MIREDQKTQYWLAELDQYDNAKLHDGAHPNADAVKEAMVLYKKLGFAKGRKFAIAKVELTELE